MNPRCFCGKSAAESPPKVVQARDEIAAIADEDIDTSDIPEADEEFFKKAKLTLPGRSALSGASTHVDGSSRGRKSDYTSRVAILPWI